jgi:hypothetical protein
MANPNELNANSVYGNNNFVFPTTTPTTLVNNPASSGKLIKVSCALVTTDTVLGNAQVTLSRYTEDDLGGTEFQIANDIVVPFRSAVILIDTTSAIYLKEDQSLGVYATGNNEASVSVSWEEIT